MATSKHTIKLPIIVSADDYHDLELFTVALSAVLGVSVDFQDMFTTRARPDDVDIYRIGHSDYHYAIVFSGKQDEHINELIKKFLGSNA